MVEEVQHLFGLGTLEPPYVINIVLHTPTQGGQRGTPANLMNIVSRVASMGVPAGALRINVSSMGRTQLPITTIALAMGLNVRVGMEDNVLLRRGQPVERNSQLVQRTVRIANELGGRLLRPVRPASSSGSLLPTGITRGSPRRSLHRVRADGAGRASPHAGRCGLATTS